MAFISNIYFSSSVRTTFYLKKTNDCKVTRLASFWFSRFPTYKRKEETSAEIIFRVAEICLSGSPDSSIQKFFGKMIRFYIHACPYTTYVTEAALNQQDSMYHADQFFYAEWCHMTVLATRALFQKTDDLHEYVRLGGRSRGLLARICFSEDRDRFGRYRWKKDMTVGLLTPINDPSYPQYHPWFALTHRRFQESCGNYEIFTVDIDGKKYRGTAFRELRNGTEEAIFYWMHRKKSKRVHQICQNWLKKVMGWHGENADEFYWFLGMYYHALTQYSPFERGSATFSMIQVIACILEKAKVCSGIILPKAVTLLDCYALSLQAEEFVEKVFIPWCKGDVGDQDLRALLEKE